MQVESGWWANRVSEANGSGRGGWASKADGPTRLLRQMGVGEVDEVDRSRRANQVDAAGKVDGSV
jgi:hypothetical protein